MKTNLAFDIYGTLFETSAVVHALTKYLGSDIAKAFSKVWRDKQLEYSFRRGLMGKYKDFSVCTKDAFEYSCLFYDLKLSDSEKTALINTYATLPCFNDVLACLNLAKSNGFNIYAFSNGGPESIKTLLTHAKIINYFIDIISVKAVSTFKPSPIVYNYLLSRITTEESNTWLISANPFDVIGAIEAGLYAVWLKRNPKDIFDPWGLEPTITIESLRELVNAIKSK